MKLRRILLTLARTPGNLLRAALASRVSSIGRVAFVIAKAAIAIATVVVVFFDVALIGSQESDYVD
ncbi:MAG: hypothetical protein JO166_21045 [Deltaproteobacteria bacterium]|nr:hypothetical protein [Deltaproteobacteria bacterium]